MENFERPIWHMPLSGVVRTLAGHAALFEDGDRPKNGSAQLLLLVVAIVRLANGNVGVSGTAQETLAKGRARGLNVAGTFQLLSSVRKGDNASLEHWTQLWIRVLVKPGAQPHVSVLVDDANAEHSVCRRRTPFWSVTVERKVREDDGPQLVDEGVRLVHEKTEEDSASENTALLTLLAAPNDAPSLL